MIWDPRRLLAVWAHSDDVIAAHIRAAAEARGARTVLSPADGPTDVSATDLASWVIGGADLDDVRAQLLLAFPTAFVVDGSDPLQAEERRQLALAAFTSREERGVRSVNSAAALAFEPKPRQLDALMRAGLPLPRTMITSMPLAALKYVDALEAEGARAIVKPMIGGATARVVDAHVREQLLAKLASPVIVQELMEGDDVRATVVAGRVVSAVVIETDGSAIDYRDDPAYRAGDARYTPLTLPADVEALVLRAAALCQHTLSGVDLKRARTRSAGLHGARAWTLLECNAAPRFLDIEMRTGHAITAALLDALLTT